MYDDSPDDVIGYVKWSDLFATDGPGWAERVRSMPSVPESIAVSDALARLREADAELALVLDEYGGTAGILSIRDVLAEIAARHGPLDGAVLPGSTPVHVLTDLPGLALEEGQAATIAGYVIAKLGHVPGPGERVPAGAWDIVVEHATDHRVVSTRVVRRAAAASSPGRATSA